MAKYDDLLGGQTPRQRAKHFIILGILLLAISFFGTTGTKVLLGVVFCWTIVPLPFGLAFLAYGLIVRFTGYE